MNYYFKWNAASYSSLFSHISNHTVISNKAQKKRLRAKEKNVKRDKINNTNKQKLYTITCIPRVKKLKQKNITNAIMVINYYYTN